MVNSNQKGKRGEREFAAYLREYGVEARRSQQYAGGHDSQDVLHDIPGIHFEVKRTEALQLHPAMEQAAEDATEGDIPVVAFRRNRGKWVAILPMDDLMKLIAKAGLF